jgi:hypothetical protein
MNHWTEEKATQVKLSGAAPLPHARFRSSLGEKSNQIRRQLPLLGHHAPDSLIGIRGKNLKN